MPLAHQIFVWGPFWTYFGVSRGVCSLFVFLCGRIMEDRVCRMARAMDGQGTSGACLLAHYQCTCLHLCCKVIGFNLACEIIFVGSWHWLTYMSDYSKVRVSTSILGWEFVLASRQQPNLIGLCFVVYTFRSLKAICLVTRTAL